MSASQRILCTLSHSLPFTSSSSSSSFVSRTFLFLRFFHPYSTLARSPTFTRPIAISHSTMPRNQQRGGHKEQSWKEKTKADGQLSATGFEPAAVADEFAGMHITESGGVINVPAATLQFGGGQPADHSTVQCPKTIWKPRSYGTVSGTTTTEVENTHGSEVASNGVKVEAEVASAPKVNVGLSKLFSGNLLENFTVDNSTYSLAHVRATFYPKFENEKSDQEIRTRMIEMVSKGLATLEVSLKHSGSLFMYAGHKGGAYAKNSFGNMYAYDSVQLSFGFFFFI